MEGADYKQKQLIYSLHNFAGEPKNKQQQQKIFILY